MKTWLVKLKLLRNIRNRNKENEVTKRKKKQRTEEKSQSNEKLLIYFD